MNKRINEPIGFEVVIEVTFVQRVSLALAIYDWHSLRNDRTCNFLKFIRRVLISPYLRELNFIAVIQFIAFRLANRVITSFRSFFFFSFFSFFFLFRGKIDRY